MTSSREEPRSSTTETWAVLARVMAVGGALTLLCLGIALLGVPANEKDITSALLLFAESLVEHTSWYLALVLEIVLGLYAVLFGTKVVHHRTRDGEAKRRDEQMVATHHHLAFAAQLVAASSIPFVVASVAVTFADAAYRATAVITGGMAILSLALGGLLHQFEPFGRVGDEARADAAKARFDRMGTPPAPSGTAIVVSAVAVVGVAVLLGGASEAILGEHSFGRGAALALVASVVLLGLFGAVMVALLAFVEYESGRFTRGVWHAVQGLVLAGMLLLALPQAGDIAWPVTVVFITVVLAVLSMPPVGRVGEKMRNSPIWVLARVRAHARSARELHSHQPTIRADHAPKA